MNIGYRSVGVLVLSVLLVFETSASSLATAAAPMPPARANDASTKDEGTPRWVWITLAALGAAATIALVFAFVIVPKSAENAGRAAANAGGESGGDPLVP